MCYVYIFDDFYIFGLYIYDDSTCGHHINGEVVCFEHSQDKFFMRDDNELSGWTYMSGVLEDHLYYCFIDKFGWKIPELEFRRTYKWKKFERLAVNFGQGDINFIY